MWDLAQKKLTEEAGGAVDTLRMFFPCSVGGPVPSPLCPYLTPARADEAQMGLSVPSPPSSPLELALLVLIATIQAKYLALVPGGLGVSLGKVCDTQATISNPMHLGHFFPSEGNRHKGRTLPDGEEAAAPSLGCLP